MASDVFFPFRDGIDAAAAAGVTCVIQPWRFIRDDEVIAAADETVLRCLHPHAPLLPAINGAIDESISDR
ncbi:hypothetical protein ACNKHL_24485 [Shigella flexneri]